MMRTSDIKPLDDKSSLSQGRKLLFIMILWKNYENNEKNIWGYALVYKGFDAFLHKHKEAETYYFIYVLRF